ncbi:hypothetical protein AAEO56_16360 [Flavobacterium sp. DGU11]|uniref:Uncharacterized protein n=1 Tax=Flavobacterium arundinis TaxID=3139143 RepID=A0ABU9I0A1_9FLAO
MIHFSTNVLRHSASWTTSEEACTKISGFPDNVVLNVNEGYEVLHFVSGYMSYRGWHSEITFQNIESVIKTRLPFTVRTHKEVKDWLDTSFRK